MKKAAELSIVGQFSKPHGIHGEISAETDIAADALETLPCIFVDFDGLMVPFFIKNLRPKGRDIVLIGLDGINDEKAALPFSHKDIYAEKEFLPENEDGNDDIIYLQDMEGFEVFDRDKYVGKIIGIDDSTDNILFNVSRGDGNTLLIPASEDLIDEVDIDKRTITMDLPYGLTDL